MPSGESSTARLIAKDEQLDVVLIQLEPDNGKLPDLIPIAIGDSRAVRPGQWVIAMGHLWGVAEAAASGIVVEGGSDLPESPGAEREWIAVHLALRPGYSGGPLVDHQGKLIGLMAGLEVGTADPYHVTEGFVAKAISADARESDTILV